MLGEPGCLRNDLAHVSDYTLDSGNICRPQDASRNIATTPNSNHKIRLELAEDLRRSFLAQFMDLSQSRTLATALVLLAQPPRYSCGYPTHLIVGYIVLFNHFCGFDGPNLWDKYVKQETKVESTSFIVFTS